MRDRNYGWTVEMQTFERKLFAGEVTASLFIG